MGSTLILGVSVRMELTEVISVKDTTVTLTQNTPKVILFSSEIQFPLKQPIFILKIQERDIKNQENKNAE